MDWLCGVVAGIMDSVAVGKIKSFCKTIRHNYEDLDGQKYQRDGEDGRTRLGFSCCGRTVGPDWGLVVVGGR